LLGVYVKGVSTRRVDDVARAMGLDGISKLQVSRICTELDEVVAAWRSRPLDAGPYPFVWVDALSMKVREGGRIANTAVLVATAVGADGHREVVGLDIGSAEDGAVWTAFLRGLVARGLGGVRLVVSDAHGGLKGAIAAVLDGASWQRCRTHFMRNLLATVPRHAQPMRRYTIAAGKMEEWVAEWSAKIRPLRQQHGFGVLGAWVVAGTDEFLWLLGYDGPLSWEDADAAYYASPQRTALGPDPARHIA